MRTDPGLLATLHSRARILASIRNFFNRDDFIEVTTPSLVRAPDPATHLDSFETHFHATDGSSTLLYLPTSPEHHMKRMLVAGMKRIYQIGPFFRNRELSPLHNPDFTGLEWYQVGASVEDTMTRTEQLVFHLVQQVLGKTMLERGGQTLNLEPPYRRMTVREALAEYAAVEIKEPWSLESLRKALERTGYTAAPDDSLDDLVHRLMLERVDSALAKSGPAFLYGYPAAMAAQARLRSSAPDESERFELYIGGLELCNGYGELEDAVELRTRFEAQLAERRRLGKTVPLLDEAYLVSVDRGLPGCSGCALGVDRLVMLLCEKESIEDVVAFPFALELKHPNLA